MQTRSSTFKQLENLKHETLRKEINNLGTPQGSVLGPLLFLLFINDLPMCCPEGKTRLFADDTTIFYHSNNINDIISKGKIIMTQLTTRFKSNKLTLNADKSSFTIFKSSKKSIPNLPDKIKFMNHEINRTSHIKFLGIILDENLTWNLHINEICNKLKRRFHIFIILDTSLAKITSKLNTMH